MQALLLIPVGGGQFHFGENGLEDSSDLLHSDTLFSALANIYEYALSGAEIFIDLVESGRLSFSSGMYALLKQGEMSLLFVPKPVVTYRKSDDRKLHKSLKYFSLGVLEEFRKSFESQKHESELDLSVYSSIGNEFLCLADELGGMPDEFKNRSFRRFTTSPKVKVHTTFEDNDRLYHETTVQFHTFSAAGVEYGGAYCVLFNADALTYEERQEFLAALRIMADEGVGGQRSSGKGQFREVREVTIDIPDEESASAYLGLSIVSPADDSEFNALERYELFVRGGGSLGWRGDSERHRKQARFVKEGALFTKNIAGALVDVSPEGDKTILRNGMNFSIPI
uniref:CRISPR system Cms protein Csm4 n=1 Tax=Chlorobium phaeobacteroides (strain BS1) TaxID=331678 RepID=B3EIY7_CHLPB